jgi:hypothetical protein
LLAPQLPAQDEARVQIMRAVAAAIGQERAPRFVGVDATCAMRSTRAVTCPNQTGDSMRAQVRAEDARALAVALRATFLGNPEARSLIPSRGPRLGSGSGIGRCAGLEPVFVSIATTGIQEVERRHEWRVPIVTVRMFPTGCAGSLVEGDYVVQREGDSLRVIRFIGRRSAIIE